MATAAAALTGVDVEANVPRVVRALMGLTSTTPAELAASLRIGRSSLSERMTGKRRFTVAEVYEMASLFGVKPGLFFEDPEVVVERLSASGYKPELAVVPQPAGVFALPLPFDATAPALASVR